MRKIKNLFFAEVFLNLLPDSPPKLPHTVYPLFSNSFFTSFLFANNLSSSISPSPSFPSFSSFAFSVQQCFLPQSPLMFKDQMQQDVIMVLKFPSNSPVTHVAANTLPHLTLPAVVTITCSRLFAVNRWHNTVGEWEPLCVLANQLIA